MTETTNIGELLWNEGGTDESTKPKAKAPWYDEGWTAYNAGQQKDRSPYDADKRATRIQSIAWAMGWQDAQVAAVITGHVPQRPVDTSPESKEQALKEWRESADDAIKALRVFQDKTTAWSYQSVTNEEFQLMIRAMADEGLDRWLDGNPLDLDRLAQILGAE